MVMRLVSLVGILVAGCGGGATQHVKEPQPVESDPVVVACEAGTVRSCLAAASAAESAGKAEEAVRHYGRACELGEASGCAFAGALLLEDPSTLGRAAETFEHGCELGDGTSCYGAGLVWSGVYGGTADDARAAGAFNKGCAAGLVDACGAYAEALEEGRGVTADPAAAAELRQRACDQGDGASCIALAAATRPKDPDAADALLERACELDGRACTRRGVLLVDVQKSDDARDWFRRGCGHELADPDACAWLGWFSWEGIGAEPSREEGAALLSAACENESALACMFQAVTAARAQEAERAEALLARACELEAQCEVLRQQFESLSKP